MTIWALIVAVLVAGICWYFGADVWHSVLLGSVFTTVGLITLVGTAERDLGAGDRDLGSASWQGGPRPNRDGARSEVAELSWSLRASYGRVDNRAVSRARQLARHRLALNQLDLNEPGDRAAVEGLIGRSAYAVLVRRERRPSLRSLLHCLDALDALNALASTMPTAMPTAPPARPRRLTPTLVRHRLRRPRAS